MDPEKALADALILAKRIDKSEGEGFAANDAAQLAEYVLNLDQWFRNGGFFPEAWLRNRRW